MDLKNVTSQLDRHQMLMDLAVAVKTHMDQNPQPPTAYFDDEGPYPMPHVVPSSK